jgi:O-antigen/teichoic acid export membrane protein
MISEGRRMRSLASQSLIYGMGGFIGRASGFFLVPIYLHAAGARAYGVVDLMLSAVLLASIMLRMGIVTTMSRFTLGEGSAKPDWAPVIHTIFSFVMAVATLGVLIGLLLRYQIGHLLEVNTSIVLAGLFGLWISMNYDVMARVYRIERRARAWVQFTLLNVLLTTVLTLVLVIGFNQGALGLLIGNFTGTALVYVVVVIARRRTIGVRKFDRPVLWNLLTYSLPLMPANIALWALNLADRIQVQRLAGHTELGVYSVAARVAVPVLVLMGAFQTAWAPFAHEVRGQEGDAQAKRTYASVLTYWSVVMGWGLVCISMIAPPYIGYSMPKSTQGAAPVVVLLAGGTVLYGGYLIVNIGVTISKRTLMTPLIASIAAAVNLGLNFWAIPRWGIVGAGVTTVIGYALLLWLGWLNAQRSYPVPYEWSRVSRVAGMTVLFLVLSQWVIPPIGLVGVPVRLLAAALFPLTLVPVGGLTRGDVRKGWTMLNRRLGRRPAGAET